MDQNTAALLTFFEYDHLSDPHLQVVSARLRGVAHAMADDEGMQGPEVIAGMRKLLEAKDCFVRAALVGAKADTTPPQPPPEAQESASEAPAPEVHES